MTNEQRVKRIADDTLTCLEIFKDNTLTVVGKGVYDHKIYIISISTFECFKILEAHKFRVAGLTISNDQKRMYSISAGHEVLC